MRLPGVKCPNCKRKGLSAPFTLARCQYCKHTFPLASLLMRSIFCGRDSRHLRDVKKGQLFRMLKNVSIVWVKLVGNDVPKKKGKSACAVVADDDQFNSQDTYMAIGETVFLDDGEQVDYVEWDKSPSFRIV